MSDNDTHPHSYLALLDQVCRNDPDCTSVTLIHDPDLTVDELTVNTHATLLGKALHLSLSYDTTTTAVSPNNQINTMVDQLYVSIHQLTPDGGYESLLHWIRYSRSLEQITLDGSGDYTMPLVSPLVVARFLDAIKDSATIVKIELVGCYHVDASVFASFVQFSSAIELEMDCAVFLSDKSNTEDEEREDVSAKTIVAAAFRGNRHLKRLYMEITYETQPFAVQIIQELAWNVTLQHLVLEWSPPARLSVHLEVTQALEMLLTQSSTLKHLELHHFEFDQVDQTVEPFIRGLASSNIDDLSLQFCRLDESATQLLESAIVSKTNKLRALALSRSRLGVNNEKTLPMLVNILRNKASTVSTLQLDFPKLSDKVTAEFADAVHDSPILQSLSMYYLENLKLFDELVRCIPSMRYLKGLRLKLADVMVQSDDRKDELIDALRQNSSLIRCEILPIMVTQVFARRNQELMDWFAAKLEPELRAVQFPKLLGHMKKMHYGGSLVFQTLVRLSDVVGYNSKTIEQSSFDMDEN